MKANLLMAILESSFILSMQCSLKECRALMRRAISMLSFSFWSWVSIYCSSFILITSLSGYSYIVLIPYYYNKAISKSKYMLIDWTYTKRNVFFIWTCNKWSWWRVARGYPRISWCSSVQSIDNKLNQFVRCLGLAFQAS